MRRFTIHTVISALLLGWPAPGLTSAGAAPPSLNPFAAQPDPPSEPKPGTESANPFAPKTPAKDAGGASNPFAPKGTKPDGAAPAPKPLTTPKPKEEPAPPAAPKSPAEVVVGSGWKVKPDPSTRPTVSVVPAAIASPGAPASTDARRERTRYRIITPNVPASVVGIGLNEKEGDSRDIWDLGANRKLGTIKGLALEGSRFMALSPDGLLFAAKPQFDDFVVVVNVTTGKTQKTIPLAGVRLDLLAFSAPNRLLLAEDGRILVHSLPDGRREREIKIDGWSVRDGWTLSPGGKYLAAVHREMSDRNLVTFVDLTTGETAGACRLTGEAGDGLGIAITRDGTRLASIVDKGDGAVISLIDLAAPKRLPDIAISGSDLFADDGYQGPVLEWLPDGKHLLAAGRVAVDTAAGEIARTLPPPPIAPLVTIGPAATLAFHGRELAELPLGLSIDPGLITAIKTPVDTPPVDLVGPAVTQADRSKAVEKQIGPAGRWDVRLNAPPNVPDKLDTNGFKIPGGFIHQALLAPGVPPVAVISYAAAPLSNGAPSDTASWAEVFDLQTGAARNRVDFAFPTVAVSVGPGGKAVATLSQDGAGRVDIWSMEDDRHLGGFQPAGQRPDRQVPWMVELIDDEHLLVAVTDELSLWEIPACRQVYTLGIGAIRPTLSPARDHVLVSVPGESRVAVVETLTGSVRGAIATSSLQGDEPLAATFHSRGRWAAVLSGGAGGGEIVVVETDSGKETARIRVPVCSDVLQFCDDDHLLVGGESLVSLAKERVVWTYQLPTGLHVRDSLGGYHWYVAAINPSDKSYILYAATLPEDQARKQIQSAASGEPVIFRPTDTVRIDVSTADLAAPHIIKHVKETFTKRYESAGMKTAEDAQYSFMVDPGRMGILKTSVWKVSLLQAGQTIWVSWIHGTPDGALLQATEPTGTETRFADPPEVRTALAALLKFEPPKYAFARGAALGSGTSLLTTSGPRPQK